MCTVTWWNDAHAYEVFFNRDELKSRLPEIPPSLSLQEGVRYLAPQDGNAGGTWLSVNEYGVTVGLLNHYPGPVKANSTRISRGLLVKSLVDCVDAARVSDRLSKENLMPFAPFMLFCLEPGMSGMMWIWDGQTLKTQSDAKACLPYTSSSYRSEEVVQVRRHLFFDRLTEVGHLQPDHLNAFHHFRFEEAGAYSVCMEREDARTVSLSRIRVQPGSVHYEYAPRMAEPDGMFGAVMSFGIDCTINAASTLI